MPESLGTVWAEPSDDTARPFWASSEEVVSGISAVTLCIPPPTSDARKLSSHKPSFKHCAIDHIRGDLRLIRLHHRSSADTPVECTMESFSAPPPYHTLSYTWTYTDESTGRDDILINGECFQVTDNLYDFLCCQSRDEAFCQNQFLWIDQVCIDQNDVTELSFTVRRMGQIYASAVQTMIWLGTGLGNESRYGLNWAMRKVKTAPATVARLGHSDLDLERTQLYGYIAEGADNSPADALGCLAQLRYWDRMWIVQEVLMSRKITLKSGDVEITWEALEHYGKLCFEYHMNLKRVARWNQGSQTQDLHPYVNAFRDKSLRGSKLDGLVRLREQWLLRQDKDLISVSDEATYSTNLFTWRHALPFTKNRSCSVAKDRLFGALGLVSPRVAISASYDYESELMAKMVLATEASQDPHATWYDGVYCCPVATYTSFARDLRQALGLPELSRNELVAEVEGLLARLTVGEARRCSSGPCFVAAGAEPAMT